MPYGDEHDITLYFGLSSPHASKYFILDNFFHDPSCDLTLNILITLIDGLSSFIP